jgi:hypothetical protein
LIWVQTQDISDFFYMPTSIAAIYIVQRIVENTGDMFWCQILKIKNIAIFLAVHRQNDHFISDATLGRQRNNSKNRTNFIMDYLRRYSNLSL